MKVNRRPRNRPVVRWAMTNRKNRRSHFNIKAIVGYSRSVDSHGQCWDRTRVVKSIFAGTIPFNFNTACALRGHARAFHNRLQCCGTHPFELMMIMQEVQRVGKRLHEEVGQTDNHISDTFFRVRSKPTIVLLWDYSISSSFQRPNETFDVLSLLDIMAGRALYAAS